MVVRSWGLKRIVEWERKDDREFKGREFRIKIAISISEGYEHKNNRTRKIIEFRNER